MIRTRPPRRGPTFVVAALTALTAASPALAQGTVRAADAAGSPAEPPAKAGDPTASPKTIDPAVSPKPGDPTASPKPDEAGPSPVTAEALQRAAEATEQATRFRAAGDESHAKAADGLAREWSETARDLALAAAAEKLADERKRQSMKAQEQLERTRALVEEGIARLGRLRAELEGGPSRSTVAVESHDGQPGRVTAGKPRLAATGSTP
jgi:hypothetical protein